MPALANGTIKRLIVSVYVLTAGRVDIYSKVAGAAILRGDQQGLGKITLDFEHQFNLGDIITWQFQRNSSTGQLDYGCFCEIEWDEAENIKHWYGGRYTGGTTANMFFEIGEMSRHALFPLTTESIFQRPMIQSGTILSYGFFGVNPVSAALE